MLPVRQRARRERGAAGRERALVDLALERRARLGRREDERRPARLQRASPGPRTSASRASRRRCPPHPAPAPRTCASRCRTCARPATCRPRSPRRRPCTRTSRRVVRGERERRPAGVERGLRRRRVDRERARGRGRVAASARTENVCSPSASAPGENGDVHAANSPASSLHSNVAPGSVEENVNGGPPGASVSGSGSARRRAVDRELGQVAERRARALRGQQRQADVAHAVRARGRREQVQLVPVGAGERAGAGDRPGRAVGRGLDAVPAGRVADGVAARLGRVDRELGDVHRRRQAGRPGTCRRPRRSTSRRSGTGRARRSGRSRTRRTRGRWRRDRRAALAGRPVAPQRRA